MTAPNQPSYSQKLLRRLIWETKDIDDLCSLCDLYRSLEAQGDITITYRLRAEVKIQQKILTDRDRQNNLNQ